MKRVGLTLGKFAPLHKGHQLLIETALAEMDEVIVLIYDAPEVTAIPLSVRANWIRQLYPGVQVIEAWNGPSEVGYSDAIKKAHEDYVIHELGLSGITHFYSSEAYGEHMSKALQAQDRRVDCARSQVPVSATDIRQDAYAKRAYVDPRVYRDLVTQVVLLGAPSTGKTTLASTLAEHFNTCWVPEYGREYWEQNQVDRRLRPDELLHIAERQLELEAQQLSQANQYLFSDTNALVTEVFCRHYHAKVPERLRALSRQTGSHYDIVFLCDDDIPFDDTWDRSGIGQRTAFQRQIIQALQGYRIPYITLSGDLPERIAKVEAVLSRYYKYSNLLEVLSCHY